MAAATAAHWVLAPHRPSALARRCCRGTDEALLRTQPRVFPHEKKDLGRDGPARSPGRQRPAVHAADCRESRRPTSCATRPAETAPSPTSADVASTVRTRCSSAQPAPACTAIAEALHGPLTPDPHPPPARPLLTYTRQFACIQVDNQFEAEGYSLGVERGCAVASDKKVLLSLLLVIVGTGTLRRSPPPLPYLLAQSLLHAAFSRPRRSDRPRTTLQHHLPASPPPRPAAPESAALKAERRLHRTRRRFAARILRAATLMFFSDAA